jgi:hypothetical protein
MSARRALWLFALVLFGMVQERDGTWRQPVNEDGEPCPFPFDPPQLYGQPIGQYHCPYCGAMVLAGMPHLDYAAVEWDGHALTLKEGAP